MPAEICIIAALSENRVIGKDGKIPWYISEDLKRFRELTTPHPIIMGRKTFESIGKPLPLRTNIIITRDLSFTEPRCMVVHSLEDGITAAKVIDNEKIFIVGGGEIYAQAIEFADRLYLTLVERNFEGDTFFPDYSQFTNVVPEIPGESEGLRYKFVELTR